MTNSHKSGDELSYAEATRELEQILDEIETGDADVDVLSDKVERASRLIRLCQQKIAGAELKVRKVLDELATADADHEGGDAE